MAEALGWVSVPIVPTFEGVGKKLSDQLVKPAKKAGQEASREVKKSTEDIVKSLEKQIDASSGKLKKFEQEQADASAKRESQQHKVNAAIEEQAAAEKKYQDQLKKGGNANTEKAKLERATAKVVDETLKLEKAQRDLNDVEDKVQRQEKDLTDTKDKLRKSQEKLTKEMKDAETPLGRLRQGFSNLKDEVRQTASEMDDIDIEGALGKGLKGGAMAAGAGVAAAFGAGMGPAMQAEMESLRVYGNTAGQGMMSDMGQAIASSGALPLGEATALAGQISGQFNNIGMDGEKIARESGDEMAVIGKTWNIEAEQMVLAASAVMSNGMATSMEEVLDLQSTYFQGHTEQVVDEMLEASKEYSGAFQTLGLDYEDMLATLDVGGALGPMGVDKVGDMFNELSRVMKNDITPEMEETFGTLGVNLDDIQDKMANGMGAEAVQQLITEIGKIEDPAEQAAAATALFGTPYEVLVADGTLDQLNLALGDQAQLARDSAGAAGELSEAYGDTLSGRIEKIKSAVQGVATEGFMWLYDVFENYVMPVATQFWEFFETNVLPMLQRLWEWIVQNRDMLLSIAVAIGAAVTVWGLWTGAVKAWAAATLVAEAAQRLFNKAMNANKIMLIVAAIAAVVAGLTYFFTQTELGQEIWAKFTEALKAGWDWLYANALQPMITFFTETLWPALQNVFTWIGDAWSALMDGISWWYENITKPVFEAMRHVVMDILWPALQSAFTWIGNAWQGLSDRLTAVWTWIRDNVLQALMNKIGQVKDWFSARIEDIKGIWQGLSDRLSSVWNWVNDNVFGAMGRALDTLKGWFQNAIDGIRTIWDGLKEAAASPVRFVVNTVWNEGLRVAWNKIADFLPGLDPVDPVSLSFATGGVLPGYTPGFDVHDFYSPTAGYLHLSGGEAIMRPEWTRAVGGPQAVEEMNEAAREGRLDPTQLGIRHAHMGFASGGVIPERFFASGGVIDSMIEIVKAKYPQLQMTSGYRPGDSGYHGRGLATDWSNGSGNTPAQLALAQDINQTYPGSAQLIYAAPGWSGNIYEGGPAGAMDSGIYKTAQAGRHDHHVHWAMTVPPTIPFGGGVFEGGSGGGGSAGLWSWVLDKAKPIWDKATEGIRNGIDNLFNADRSRFHAIPGAAFTSIEDAAWNFVSGKFPSAGSGGGALGSPEEVERYRDGIIAAFHKQGEDPLDYRVDALLRQIWTESKGDPNIAQQIVDVNGTGESAGVGLYQVIPGTFADYRDPTLPNDRRNVEAAHNFAVRYFRDRHNWDTGPTGVGNPGRGWKTGGVLPDFSALAGMLGAKVFDTGGILRNGETAINLSGADEIVINNKQLQALSKLANNVGVLVKQLAESGNVDAFVQGMSDEFKPGLQDVQQQLHLLADPDSLEGVTVRQATRRVLDIGGDSLPGAGIITSLLDGEDALRASRSQQLEMTRSVEQAQREYDKALLAHQEALKNSDGSEEDLKRIADAEAAVNDAADDDSRIKAEEDLARVRKEVTENSVQGIKDAEEAVSEAQVALHKERSTQAAELQGMLVLTQQDIMGLSGGFANIAARAVDIGVPADLAAQGLGAVTGVLGSIAGAVGPAGISLHTVFTMIEVVGIVISEIEKFIQKIQDAISVGRQTVADFLGEVHSFMEIVADYRHLNAKSTQEYIRLQNDVRLASMDLATAVRDGFRNMGDAERSMFAERKKLDEMMERSHIASQLKAKGLMEDISSAINFQLDEANKATVEMTDEMWEQYWLYESTRATVEGERLRSQLALLEAEFALEDAKLVSVRNQQDVNRQLERAAGMLARANGIEAEDAALASMFAGTMVELAALEQEWDDNWFKRMFNQDYSAGLSSEMAYLRSQLSEMSATAGMGLSQGQIDSLVKKAATAEFWDLDPLTTLKGAAPELAKALQAADSYNRWQPYYDVVDREVDNDRELDDLRKEIDRFEQTFNLEQQIQGYDSIAAAFARMSESYGDDLSDEERDSLRKEFQAEMAWALANTTVQPVLDERYADIHSQIPQTVQVVVEGGRVYNEDEVVEIVDGAIKALGLDVTVEKKASTLAKSRRNQRV